MNHDLQLNTGLSLTDTSGRQLLETSLRDYVAFLHTLPAVCGSPEQQESLIQHVAQGHELIKLVTNERLKITRQLDKQKHDWIEIERELTAPIVAAMQPIKDAVEHYNREVIRVRQHQQANAERAQQVGQAETKETNWLLPEVALVNKPKGVQMKWTFEVIDRNQVPNGYWTIDQDAIKADVANGLREIPGVRIYEEMITTFRK